MHAKLRIARPVTDLDTVERMYCGAFGLSVLYRFDGHDGFNGIMLGMPGSQYHFEFTVCTTHPVKPVTTPEDLVVFYIPDELEHAETCYRAGDYGFKRVKAFNPYWSEKGSTFEDADGYRVVLANMDWSI